MKSFVHYSVLAFLLLFCRIETYAQIQVKSDGGVKVGTPPEQLYGVSSWDLQTKGMEVNIGDIKLHTEGGGYMFLTGKASPIYSSPVNQGSIGIVINPTVQTYLTGKALNLGTTENAIWHIQTNSIYTKTPSQTLSDKRMKDNIAKIVDARSYVMKLNPVTFDLRPWDGFVGDSSLLLNKAGFIAQEVLDVIPGAVGYDKQSDQYSLDYSYFIPYLTRTIQEQDEQIRFQAERVDALEQSISELENLIEVLLGQNELRKDSFETSNQGSDVLADGAKLFQNRPNPFSEETRISFTLPLGVSSAQIMIHSMGGKVVKDLSVSPDNGNSGSVIVKAGSMSPGVYTYSLVVNGKIVDAKKLIVTE